MRRSFSDQQARYEILTKDSEILSFRDLASALRFLRPFKTDTAQMSAIRAVLSRNGRNVVRLSDEETLKEFAALLISGRVRLLKTRMTTESGVSADDVAPAAAQTAGSAPPQGKKTHWIEIKVLVVPTDDPLPNLSVKIELPDGRNESRTTDSAGMIRLDDLPDGYCTVRSNLQDSNLGNVFQRVEAPPAAAGKGDKIPAGKLSIAVIDPHPVHTGESIKSLAEQAGLTWQFLSRFNWGTEVPAEINNHLRDQVGCRNKTKDGKNYVFDDSDDPGIVYIPKIWELSGLVLDQRHVIRVEPFKIKPKLGLIIPLEMDIDGDPLQDDEVRLRNTGGTWHKILYSSDEDVEEDQKARLMYYRFRSVPEGNYEVDVKIAGKWTSILAGITVAENSVSIGKDKLKETPPEINVADPDSFEEGEAWEYDETEETADPGFQDQLENEFFGPEDDL